MPDGVEVSVLKALKGLPLDTDDADICDFTLEEQNAALEAQGVTPTVDPGYKPVCSETVVYVVAAVVLNEKDEVLMMQEAKQSCAGKVFSFNFPCFHNKEEIYYFKNVSCNNCVAQGSGICLRDACRRARA